MNVKLVESLAAIINSLNLEERQLLQRKVKLTDEIAPIQPTLDTDAPSHQWIEQLRQWSMSHHQNTPLLSDKAVSRAGIYEEE